MILLSRFARVLLALHLSVLPYATAAPGAFVAMAAAQEQGQAVVITDGGRHVFSVELADTPATRSRGLMYRRELAPDAGMLFDFEGEQDVTMWMSNTYISLDMIFIRADGTVARIARGTTPFSKDVIAAGEPVLSVLEVVAGTADRIGLEPGDRVEHPLFQQ